MSKNSAVAPDSLDAKDTLAHQNSTSMSEKAELKNALSVHHSDKNEPHPDLAAGPMTYTDAEFNSAHLTDNERALHGRSDNVDARLQNPLSGLSYARLEAFGAAFAKEHGLDDYTNTFSKAAVIAQDFSKYEKLGLPEEDTRVLSREFTHRWDQPRTLYLMVIFCSLGAAVQGMDESVISGANVFYPDQFNLPEGSTRDWYVGLIAGAPYLCSGLFGCWLTDPMNRYFGRRGAIFISAFFAFATCIWSAVTNTWWHLFIARFFLGIGIGPKSATVPVYAAECSPALIRGALVMMWQMWTAFGIGIGYVMDLAFLKVPDSSGIEGLNWRLMLGSAGVPAIILAAMVFLVPESPRWLVSKGRYRDAFFSLKRFRHSHLQAARDLFYMAVLLEEENSIAENRNRFKELFTVPRNRRALLASSIVMFMQQFCGVNAIVYYTTTIFLTSGFNQTSAFGASVGFGMINCIFALPAVYTIDKFGRRTLLLITFPMMSIFLLLTGFAFWIENDTARIAVVALGIYLFDMVYSPGEGPVPFTYSAEAFPLYVRELGMSWATALLWFFNFVVALTFPALLRAFTPQGAFGWYAAWNMIGWTLVLLFVPETKQLTLEELDMVFSVPTGRHAMYHMKQVPYFIQKYILRRQVEREPFYHWETAAGKEDKEFKQKAEHTEFA